MAKDFDVDKLIDVADGKKKADLVIKNCNLVNVFTDEVEKGVDIAIYDDRIAGIGKYSGKKTINARGMFASPAFIDSHIHIESSMLKVSEFTKAVVPHGTAAVVADPHEIANVLGSEGIMYILKSAKYMPLDVFMMLPSCVPATHLETAGAQLDAIDLYPFLRDRWVLGLGELMNYPGVLCKDHGVMNKIKIMEGRKIEGHAPDLSGKDLCAYIAAGPSSDHECFTIREAKEKLRRGMYIMIREGSATRNLKDLVKMVTKYNSDRCMFATDDKHPDDLHKEGHLDHSVRLAIKLGLPPITAIKMVTSTPARYFGLKKTGAIAPGYKADIILIDNLKKLNVKKVFKKGKLVAENGKFLHKVTKREKISLRASMNVKDLKEKDFWIKTKSNNAFRVIGVIKDQIMTADLSIKLNVVDGCVKADSKKDVAKIAVIERHHASGNIGLGLIKGFGLKKGAIASTVAHDSHNIVVVGTNSKDMLTVAKQIVKMKGGIAVAENGKITASLPLPIAGLMSDQPIDKVNKGLKELRNAAKRLGSKLADPFITMSFMSLPVIPTLKLTDKGLVDVNQFKIIGLQEKKK